MKMTYTKYYDLVCKALGYYKLSFDKQIQRAYNQGIEPNAAAWAIKMADRLSK